MAGDGAGERARLVAVDDEARFDPGFARRERATNFGQYPSARDFAIDQIAHEAAVDDRNRAPVFVQNAVGVGQQKKRARAERRGQGGGGGIGVDIKKPSFAVDAERSDNRHKTRVLQGENDGGRDRFDFAHESERFFVLRARREKPAVAAANPDRGRAMRGDAAREFLLTPPQSVASTISSVSASVRRSPSANCGRRLTRASILSICGPPPCATTGFAPRDLSSATSAANDSKSASSRIAAPPNFATIVAPRQARICAATAAASGSAAGAGADLAGIGAIIAAVADGGLFACRETARFRQCLCLRAFSRCSALIFRFRFML